MTGAAAFVNQRAQALELANDVRLARAKARHQVADLDTRGGLEYVADLIESPPPALEGMKVRDLLVRIYKWRDAKADRALLRAGISAVKTLAGLTPRQRTALVDYLRHA